MRACLLAAALLAAGCSPSPERTYANDVAAAATPTPARSGPGALGARKVVAAYFDRLEAHDYRAAYRMWGGAGADSRGTLAQFTAGQKLYRVFDGTAGEPTAPKITGGMEYITVEARIVSQTARQNRPVTRDGVVMLRRPPVAAGAGDQGAGWAIWGTDVRERRCRPSERAEGLGCV